MNGVTPEGIVAGLVFSLVFAFIVVMIQEITNRKKHKNHDDNLDICDSSEAISEKYKLQSEFSRLVSRIAWHNAGSEKESEAEEKILISPEDMEKAFLEAAKLVAEKCALDRCPCKTNCDKQTVLQKIRNLLKNFEKNPST